MKLFLNVLVLSIVGLSSVPAFASSLSECEATVEITKVNTVRGGYHFEGTVKSAKTVGDQGSCDWMAGQAQEIKIAPAPDDRGPDIGEVAVGKTVTLGVRVSSHEETGQHLEWMPLADLTKKDVAESQPEAEPVAEPTPEEKPAEAPAAEKKSGGCATGGLGASGLLPMLFAMLVRLRR